MKITVPEVHEGRVGSVGLSVEGVPVGEKEPSFSISSHKEKSPTTIRMLPDAYAADRWLRESILTLASVLTTLPSWK